MTRDAILQLILSKVPDATEETGLFGIMDSLELVTLIVEMEEACKVVLADERAFSRKSSPFLTVGSFADFVYECLNHRGE